jgi:hypothetical protein
MFVILLLGEGLKYDSACQAIFPMFAPKVDISTHRFLENENTTGKITFDS